MPLPFVQVDAFTAEPYRGNPAAVVVMPAMRPDAWMQAVAREMNLAETAFVTAEDDAWHLRWFTPTDEVDLCGHATLASAHHLWEAGLLDRAAPARFQTRSGLLTCRRVDDAIVMDFPATPPQPTVAPAGLAEMLGAEPLSVQRTIFDLLVELADEETVRALRPDLTRLAALDVRGVIVTAASAMEQVDIVSRFFGPRVGVPEDPVTGSAHCGLAPFWALRFGRTQLTGYQASARGGYVGMSLQGDRVVLRGQAVTVLSGTLLFDA